MTDFLQQAGLTISVVPKRPVFHKEIGQFFRQLRVARGWGLRQAGRIAEEKRLDLLNFNTLGTLERGATKNPEPELLRELASLYKVPYHQLVGRFLTHRYGVGIVARDLPDHSPDQESRSTPQPTDLAQGDAAHDATEDHLSESEQREHAENVDHFQTVLLAEQISDHAAHIDRLSRAIRGLPERAAPTVSEETGGAALDPDLRATGAQKKRRHK